MIFIVYWKLLYLTSCPTYVEEKYFTFTSMDRERAFEVYDSIYSKTAKVNIDSIQVVWPIE